MYLSHLQVFGVGMCIFLIFLTTTQVFALVVSLIFLQKTTRSCLDSDVIRGFSPPLFANFHRIISWDQHTDLQNFAALVNSGFAHVMQLAVAVRFLLVAELRAVTAYLLPSKTERNEVTEPWASRLLSVCASRANFKRSAIRVNVSFAGLLFFNAVASTQKRAQPAVSG